MAGPSLQPGAFAEGKNAVNVIIDTPRGSRLKYSHDPETGLLKVRKVLPEGMQFPFNFGFVPGTTEEDGDPLDFLLLDEEPAVAGCWLVARLLGVIEGVQTQDGKSFRNDRLIGVIQGPLVSTIRPEVLLTAPILQKIERFFVNYNQLQGRKYKVIRTGGPQEARKLVEKGIRRQSSAGIAR